ncbi:olfactory receptor 11A1-like [Boleophthalmus pectinirostris]|uniref:olfactory receptor 11A1-like n=1 Tax=Boleophthalmus pectinirostris TaxID=150288 RepID=UPI00242FCA29|nr:olfactory receptor 11A1-like [Boleophthalmus pectinirostris]
MMNSTLVLWIRLGGFYDVAHLRSFYMFVVVVLYLLILFSNVLLICSVVLHRNLHEPMYVFLCSLFFNELYGSSFVVLFVLVQISGGSHVVSRSLCLLQIFHIYSYVSVEFTNLAVISYDRYVAICRPLRYGAHMSPGRVRVLLVLVWFPPALAVGVTTLLTASLTLCGDVIDKVYCDNYSIIKLSCRDAAVNNWYELVAASVTVFCPLAVVFYTYVRILRVCFCGSAHTRHKAVSTCAPHLASLLNFAFGVSFEVIQTRFDTTHLPRTFTAFQPLYLLMCQALFNPLMYGLNLQHARRAAKHLLLTAMTSTCCSPP